MSREPKDEPEPTEEPAATEEPQDEPVATEEPAADGSEGDGVRRRRQQGRHAARSRDPAASPAAATSDIVGLTFTVNSTADTADAARGNGVCADARAAARCARRSAEADYLKGDDRIEFNLSGHGAGDHPARQPAAVHHVPQRHA